MPRKNVRWTQNKRNKLRRAINKDLASSEIAKLFNTTKSAVLTQKSLMLKSGELKIKPKYTGYRWIMDKITDRVPKSELRKSPNYYHFRKYPEMVEKIHQRKSPKKNKLFATPENKWTRWNDENIKKLIQMYQDGKDSGLPCMETEELIAKKLGVGRSVVSTRKSLATKQGYVFPKFERSKQRRIRKFVDNTESQYRRNMEFWDGFNEMKQIKQNDGKNKSIEKAIETLATGFELIAEALRDINKK